MFLREENKLNKNNKDNLVEITEISDKQKLLIVLLKNFHAMSYVLTSHYGTAHGFAVSLFISSVWNFINEHTNRCSDERGCEYLSSNMKELETLITPTKFDEIVNSLELKKPELKNETAGDLALKVNEARLKNTPVRMYQEDIEKIYTEVLK